METTHASAEFTAKMLQSIDDGKVMAYRLFWDTYMSLIIEYWLAITIFLVIVFAIALAQAFLGYWAMLESVLYNTLYFGTLFIIGLIKGPEFFVNFYFELFCIVLLYPICYFIVGVILDWLGVRRR